MGDRHLVYCYNVKRKTKTAVWVPLNEAQYGTDLNRPYPKLCFSMVEGCAKNCLFSTASLPCLNLGESKKKNYTYNKFIS